MYLKQIIRSYVGAFVLFGVSGLAGLLGQSLRAALKQRGDCALAWNNNIAAEESVRLRQAHSANNLAWAKLNLETTP